jgi:threonylcarbamoyladenosine tRNA methylthiotransferase MtaB
MKARVAFLTFGCKTNWADSVRLMNALPEHSWGVVEIDDDPDVVVLNSCTVTAKGDADLRKAVRRVLARRADTRVLVTGCTAEVYPERLAAELPGVEIYGVSRRHELFAALGASPEGSDWPAPEALATGPRTRAFLKIQEGCDYDCSYCIVPRARGRTRSLAPERVAALVARAAALDLGEVVLTGTHLGFYGHDQSPPTDLVALLDRLAGVSGLPRVRLSSVEPNEVDARLVDALGRHRWIAPHLHVALQAGDDGVLAAMRRRYDVRGAREAILRLAPLGPLGLGTDLVVGFPGETDAAFQATLALVTELPFTYLHVFSYSPRPGTDAERLPDRVPGPVVRQRVAALRALSDRKRAAFAAAHVGQRHEVLVEEVVAPGFVAGYTGTYLRARLPGSADLVNRRVPLRVTAADAGEVRGDSP